ncbi:unnamed protein product, partial [Polarella glacialis]
LALSRPTAFSPGLRVAAQGYPLEAASAWTSASETSVPRLLLAATAAAACSSLRTRNTARNSTPKKKKVVEAAEEKKVVKEKVVEAAEEKKVVKEKKVVEAEEEKNVVKEKKVVEAEEEKKVVKEKKVVEAEEEKKVVKEKKVVEAAEKKKVVEAAVTVEDPPAAKETKKVVKLKKATKADAEPVESDDTAAKLKKLQSEINKKYGEGTMVSMDTLKMDVDTFSTGALTVDLALGGGLPFGRVVEIYGPEQSGKTTMALSCIAGVQNKGGRCAFIDTECALDLDYAVKLGVNKKLWDLFNPGSAENATDLAIKLVESGLYKIVVIDSVAALTPQEELDKDMGQFTIGLLARIMSKFCRKITDLCRKHDTTLFLTNQLRANIGGYGPTEMTCGGNAVKYYASVRLEIRAPKSGILGDAAAPYGIRSKVKVTKNKLAAPHRSGEFDIIFGEGISWESSVLEASVNCGIVNKGGAWLQYKEHKVQGQEKFKELLRKTPALTKELTKLCLAKKEAAMETVEDDGAADGETHDPDDA